MRTALRSVVLSAGFLAAVFCVRADDDSFGDANIGERFFLETRFSQFFFTHSGGDANFIMTNGDPVMNTTVTVNGPLPGPFVGQAMNCRACHLVEEHENVANRTYADFARRSPVPAIGDGRAVTPRNAIDLVDSLLPHASPSFLHYDGQFTTPKDLIISTFTGRNFGWRPEEYATALANIVHVIRTDNGSNGLAQQYGGASYAQTLAGKVGSQGQYLISATNRFFDVSVTNPADPNFVSDEVVLNDMTTLMQAYMETLVFAQDADGLFNGSPYDVFLIKNGLPRAPAANETPVQYSQRLLRLIQTLPAPQYVADPADGHYVTHQQSFQFGPTELAGLKIFLTPGGRSGARAGFTGNCAACHSPPNFTDFLFHNNGAAQEEYDSIHGTGAFMALPVPGLSARLTNYDAYLEPTTNHPDALGTFITPPSLAQPGQVDLGLWNVFANPDIPAPQASLQEILPQLVGAPSPPRFTGAARSDGGIIFAGTNGTPGWLYYVLAATNLWQPQTNWCVVLTNTFDDLGNFSFTNANLSGLPQFYQLRAGGPTSEAAVPLMIGLFKTPNVRDPESSDPYFHTGRMDTIEAVINFYQNFSALARAGAVRNGDPELKAISLNSSAVAPLAAFLRALDEDYFDVPCPCL